MLLTRPANVRARAFNRGLRAARQYHARHGHLQVPADHAEDLDGTPVRLGAWLLRRHRDRAQLTPEQQTALEVLGFHTLPVFLAPAPYDAAA
ncbi:helicase associated domain-containing protein [Streptomyces cathayae]|uniref:Helicase associated domain-containing protein n=1 Tax=Streptomyces cathayae TaxID=3031124 RepID=A0ABY8JVH5_9ACTN|nr:helicase associated domain-containing protein [Streptomyces sp. HUAS 5]WGD38706.1 helicase associated domain-containing protein [Streptomyces sp. HUAS 5]WGD44739.1 helicase associated domain-containing protein [Streptomyces sp. HUAS 5]WGD45218.1 helicase associated domain-containing protein [Streptomyces sp. HUAS 5]